MSAEMRYTAFSPKVFLERELRVLESQHYAATNGFEHHLPVDGCGHSPVAMDLWPEIQRVRELLKRA